MVTEFSLSPIDLASVLNISVQAVHKLLKTMNLEPVKIGRSVKIPSYVVRKILESRGYNYPKSVFAFLIVKGGTGKSSLAQHLGIRLNQYGGRVLLVDLDQQANLTTSFGGDYSDHPTMLHYLLKGKSGDTNSRIEKIDDLVVPISSTMSLIPSSMSNSALEYQFVTAHKPIDKFLGAAIEPLKSKFDFIIFDCPPALSAVNISAAFASDKIMMPINPDKYSIDALKTMFQEFKTFAEEYQHRFDYTIILNKFDSRKTTSHEVYQTLLQHKTFSQFLLKHFVSDNHDLTKAQKFETNVFDRFKSSSVTSDLDRFAKVMLNLEGGLEPMERGLQSQTTVSPTTDFLRDTGLENQPQI